MKKRKRIYLCSAITMLLGFVLWTVLLRLVDVSAIGPNGSSVGFATLNEYVHRLTGANMVLYTVTDWLGLVPIFVAASFALSGLVQWIKRKKLLQVDRNLRLLGVFYVTVIVVYLLFEALAINYRPVLIDGVLEISYPSSTTMLVACIMPTAVLQLRNRIKKALAKHCITAASLAFTVFMIVGRVLSGVHWITDIIGALLISTGLVLLYCFFAEEQ